VDDVAEADAEPGRMPAEQRRDDVAIVVADIGRRFRLRVAEDQHVEIAVAPQLALQREIEPRRSCPVQQSSVLERRRPRQRLLPPEQWQAIGAAGDAPACWLDDERRLAALHGQAVSARRIGTCHDAAIRDRDIGDARLIHVEHAIAVVVGKHAAADRVRRDYGQAGGRDQQQQQAGDGPDHAIPRC
jgi:hypothetical protein